ncbi:hypothetical protein Moror_17792 [Moniliophthora roreri MCA 2997]|uniref:Uncharacterized protein n=1 Tax=Moniliophthora roreri (strain MCA 2997) TaxID=1381753 RepID=V2XWW5_MONRO|nr:hypothetical protein Moror_17792 [Moniliophthora roreri MCA 2997]
MIIRTSWSRAQFTPGIGGVEMTSKTARNALVSMGVLFSGFAGFYYMLQNNDKRKRVKGDLHQYESILTQAAQDRGGYQHSSSSEPTRAIPLPTHVHDAQHHSITTAIQLGKYDPNRIPQPAPQRAKGDGSELVYTKKM